MTHDFSATFLQKSLRGKNLEALLKRRGRVRASASLHAFHVSNRHVKVTGSSKFEHEILDLRGDDVRSLVTDDQHDSEDVRSGGDHRVWAHS